MRHVVGDHDFEDRCITSVQLTHTQLMHTQLTHTPVRAHSSPLTASPSNNFQRTLTGVRACVHWARGMGMHAHGGLGRNLFYEFTAEFVARARAAGLG